MSNLSQNYEKVKALKSEIWRTRLYSYAYKLSRGSWYPYQHSKYLSNKIEEAIHEDGGRLCIMQPPQTGKSTLTSIWTPVWYLDTYPKGRFILCSYSSEMTEDWSNNAKDIYANHELTRHDLGDFTRNDFWTTEKGGFCLATSVGGAMTGRRGDVIVIDDPLKGWKEANSAKTRADQKRWFDSVVNTRVQEDSTIILAMTRWHEDDLAGMLIDRGWDTVRLPALAESDDDPLGRDKGESICPDMYSSDYYKDIRDNIADVVWAGLYQQRPSVEGGTIFKEYELTNYYDKLPNDIDNWYQSWDFSFGSSGEEASFVVGLIWAVKGGNVYLVDQYRRKTDFDGMVLAVKEMSKRYPRAYTKLIEKKAAGALIVQRLKDELRGLQDIDPGSTDKEERAYAVKKCFKSNDVFLPNPDIKPWVQDYQEELMKFPNGRFDDYVDATTQFLIYWIDRALDDWW